MEAKDLMIGDWVCYCEPNNYYTKVKEIRCTSDGEEYYIRCHRDSKDTFLEQLKYEDFSVDILHPILLIPEILEKNDFKKFPFSHIEGQHQWTWWKNIATSVTLWCRELNDDTKDGMVLKIEAPYTQLCIKLNYVHELQHVLRLCGIEKEIEL